MTAVITVLIIAMTAAFIVGVSWNDPDPPVM